MLSFPVTYVTLELPKRIVNEALGEKPGWARGILGQDMERITFLLALCFAFLLFVLISGAQKYYLNVYAGRLGEQIQHARREEGCGVLLVEHDAHFVMEQCDRVVVLDQGTALETGTPQQIMASQVVRDAYLGETIGGSDA